MTKSQSEEFVTWHRQPLVNIYFSILEEMLPSITKAANPKDSILFPFVFLCAATLESLLNDRIIMTLTLKFGLDEYSSHAEAFLSMSLPAKLDIFFPLVTKDKFIIKKQSKIYQYLRELISLRNSLIHDRTLFQKGYVKLIKVSDDSSEIFEGSPSILVKKLEKLKPSNCKRYYTSLKEINRLLRKYETLHEDDTIQINQSWGAA